MSILDGDLQILNNNAFPGRNGNQPIAIIVHGTASNGVSSAVSTAHYFQSTQGGNNPVSAHYVIDKDGIVVRCNNPGDGAWGNGILEDGYDPIWKTLLHPHGSFVNPNNVTISIEHVKFDKDNHDQITDAQKTASFQLIEALCDEFRIPKQMISTTGGITGHFSISPQSRAHCPGPYPFDELISYLQEGQIMLFDENSPLFGAFFTKIDDHNWQCKRTGKHISLGMLNYYKTLSFNPRKQLPCVGLPVTDETYIHRPDNVPLSYQLCERGALIYDPQHLYDNPPGSDTVYLAHIGSGVVLDLLSEPFKKQLAAVQSQLNTCQTDLAECRKGPDPTP